MRASHDHYFVPLLRRLWLVFSKFKLVRWGWLSGTVSLLVGGFILATFLALFNYLTPSGRVTVTGRVVEVTPNVTGQIVAIPVKPNVPVKKRRHPVSDRPGAFSVQGHAITGIARGRKAERRNIESLITNRRRRTSRGSLHRPPTTRSASRTFETLAADEANTQFQAQDKQVQYETVSAQLVAAKASQQSAQLAMNSEISGVNTTVAQLQAQLDNAVGNCRRRPFVRPPTAMLPSSL